MKSQLRIAAATSCMALITGLSACSNDNDRSQNPKSSDTTKSKASTETSSPTTDKAEQRQVRIYLLSNEKVQPVERSTKQSAVAAAAMTHLLDGPSSRERDLKLSSAIPAGTRLNGVVIKDGVATVDLSKEFASGGGSASISGRVAQVVFTLTQFPAVKSVKFEIQGVPVVALGGEGLILDSPQDRTDWEDFTPAVLAETPLPFEQVESPVVIKGTANTFEAMFEVKITDGNGRVLYEKAAMATSGTGTRGTFEVRANFTVKDASDGKITLFESSARDGSPINVVEIPVRLMPS